MTHGALCCASLVVCHCGRKEERKKGRKEERKKRRKAERKKGRKEEKKKRRKEGVFVCAVCSCTSSVLACDTHSFLADKAVALSLAAASTRRQPPVIVHLSNAQLKSREVGWGSGGCFEKFPHTAVQQALS